MKKNILGLVICFILSCLVVFGMPLVIRGNESIKMEHETSSAINQNVIEYSDEKLSYNKLYNKGQLVGFITNLDKFYEGIDNEYQNYAEKFPNTTLGLSDDLYLVKEDTYSVYENRDEDIVKYLINNDLLGVKTNAIEFSTDEGVYDIIYVNNIDDFYVARDQFLLNFISEDTLESLTNNETINEPTNFGTTEMGLKVLEKMTISDAFMPPEKIFTSVNEIYNFLCYGRNEERQYYVTQEGDTLRGVGYLFQNMSPKQLMMLNPDVIVSEDQVITPGMDLNVTYFSSPLTVVVTKDRLAQEIVNAENPEYRSDPTVAAGVTRIDVEELNGLENVLYEETWINGVLQSGSRKSSVMVREPVQAIITVGTQKTVDYGSGNYIWPVDNPMVTCGWGCYYGHTGTDIVNRYERYGAIYAVDTGIVETASFHYINGNYVVIDHQNGYKTYYGHMSAMFVAQGQTVQRGDVIGQIGMTGYATGPHVHFHFLVDGVITNACNIMDCNTIPWS